MFLALNDGEWLGAVFIWRHTLHLFLCLINHSITCKSPCACVCVRVHACVCVCVYKRVCMLSLFLAMEKTRDASAVMCMHHSRARALYRLPDIEGFCVSHNFMLLFMVN